MQMLPLSNIFKHKTPAVQLSCKNLCNIKTAVNQPKNTPPSLTCVPMGQVTCTTEITVTEFLYTNPVYYDLFFPLFSK